MKNKKSIAMAMAAVSTLGTVAPVFADSVVNYALADNDTVNVGLASGYVIKLKEGSTTDNVFTRAEIYNYNGAPKDRSKHTLKSEFENCKILIEKLGATPDSDTFVLGIKNTDTAAVEGAKGKLDGLNSEIEDYVTKKGYSKNVVEADGTISGSVYTPATKTITLSKGTDSISITFTNVHELIQSDSALEVEQANALRKEVFNELALNNETTGLNLLVDTNYTRINELKYIIESNVDKFDIVKDEDGAGNKDLIVTLYKKGAKKVTGNIIKTMKFENIKDVNNELLINIPQTNDFNSHWAKTQIVDAMLNSKIDASESFRPEDSITRAEFAKIACTIFNITPDASDKEPFHDVSKGDWFYKYVAALYQEEVTVGTGSNAISESVIKGDGDNFRPNDKITRQEVAVILAKLQSTTIKDTTMNIGSPTAPVLVHTDVKTNFKDDALIATWADDSVKYLNEGIEYINEEGEQKPVAEGYNNYFNPTKDITRAEALVMAIRTYSATTVTP